MTYKKSLFVFLICQFGQIHMQIIGSSIVTSVSVLLGSDHVTTPTPFTTTLPLQAITKEPIKPVVVTLKNVTSDPGILSVIATLKNIVKEENLKHVSSSSTTTTSGPSPTTLSVQAVDEAPAISSTVTSQFDDDEIEISREILDAKPEKVSISGHDINSKLSSVANETTASSAEVHAAIHRISGALLKPGIKRTKPIENILTDVLTSFNKERNVTTSAPSSTVPSQVTTQPTTQLSSSTTSFWTMSVEPQIGVTVIHPKVNHSDESMEKDTEEDLSGNPTSTSKPIPKPTKKIPVYYFSKLANKKNNSNLSNRPSDFYDDEIFGYDPYQTFLHGVYVPKPDDENTGGSIPVPHHYHVAQLRPRPDISNIPTVPPPQYLIDGFPFSSTSSGKWRKPVPMLPDYLHRPRPSHLQYQHSAADTIDTETGLHVVKVQHPAEKLSNQKINPEGEKPAGLLKLTTSVPLAMTSRPIVSPVTNAEIPEVKVQSIIATMPTTTTTRPIINHGLPAGSQIHSTTTPKSTPSTLPPQKKEVGVIFPKAPAGNPGLEGTLTSLDPEMKTFVDLCNRLALRLFVSATTPNSQAVEDGPNVVLSPFTLISSLGMLFLGARGSTAAQLDSLLHLDDQLTFNPHLMHHNITQSFLSQANTAAAIIRLLIADKDKGDVLDFFKMRVGHFYDARVEEVDYKYAGHLAQSIINQMIRAQIQRNSHEMLNRSLPLVGPLTLLTSAFFDGHLSGNREVGTCAMEFVADKDSSPFPCLSLVGTFRAAYDSKLDITEVEIPYTSRELSLLVMMPGKSGEFSVGGLDELRSRLNIENWTSLMRSFFPREQFRVTLPRFRQQSSLNLTHIFQRLGLTEMFRPDGAKFKGINGLSDLYLDPHLMHFVELSTYEQLSDTHAQGMDLKTLRSNLRGEPLSINDWIFLSRTPPSTHYRKAAPFQRTPGNSNLPPISYTRIRSSKFSKKEERQTVVAEPLPSSEVSIKFDRPFIYVLRHNPTGMIMFIGQFVQPIRN